MRSSSTRLRERRRRHPRQDEPQRVGELPVDALDERLERPRRADAETRTRSIAIRRLELRLGGRRRREPGAAADRHRDRRLDRVAVADQLRSSASSRRSASLSRSGIVPIAHSQDTAGPMARTVADAAALLGAMAGRGSGRCGDDAPHDRRAARLLGVSRCQRPEGRAHRRRPQRVCSATAPAADRARRSGDRRDEERAAPSSSIRRTSRRSAHSTTPSSTCCCTSSRRT